jgi:hypothetical protein
MRICLIVVTVAIVVARVKAIIRPISARCTAFMPTSAAYAAPQRMAGPRHPANPAPAPGHSMPEPCVKIAAPQACPRHARQAGGNFPRFPERDLIASFNSPSQRSRIRNRPLRDVNVPEPVITCHRVSVSYLAERAPGEVTHSLIWAAVSAWVAFFINRSRRGPSGSCCAS